MFVVKKLIALLLIAGFLVIGAVGCGPSTSPKAPASPAGGTGH
jgi:hypothetical protein